MNFRRPQLIAIGLLVLVAVTSFQVHPPSTKDTTVVRSFPQAKRGSAETLFILEPVNPIPEKINFTYRSNSSITVYVQTRGQYDDMDKDVIGLWHPLQYVPGDDDL